MRLAFLFIAVALFGFPRLSGLTSTDRVVELTDAGGGSWGVVFPGDDRVEGRILRMFGPGFDCEPEARFQLGPGGLIVALYCETVEGDRRTRRSLTGAPGGDRWSALESTYVDGVLWRVRSVPLRRRPRSRRRRGRGVLVRTRIERGNR